MPRWAAAKQKGSLQWLWQTWRIHCRDLSMDACLYLNQNFDFISFPAELTTGSSIMPHKKNPDVFELVRSHSNRIKALPNEIMLMTTNLPSGLSPRPAIAERAFVPGVPDA
jgi:argininosuccinate lyase